MHRIDNSRAGGLRSAGFGLDCGCGCGCAGFVASGFIGQKGKPFAPDKLMKKILTDAAGVGSATVRTLAYRSRDPEARIYPNSAWQTPFIGG
jgi:hypothetical protein